MNVPFPILNDTLNAPVVVISEGSVIENVLLFPFTKFDPLNEYTKSARALLGDNDIPSSNANRPVATFHEWSFIWIAFKAVLEWLEKSTDVSFCVKMNGFA